MTLEDRVARTKKLLELLIDCVFRADRDQSTVQAGTDLQNRARKIFKGFSTKDQILNYLVWPAFTTQRSDVRKKPRYNVSEVSTHYAVMPQQSGMSVVNPQPIASSSRPFCPVCSKFGHTENTCYQKHPELRKK